MTALGAVDLFAGPGGWDVAASELGLDVVGIEIDPTTCETRRAAGHDTITGDVRHYGPGDLAAPGLIASPPCQPFSQAGRGAGRRSLAEVLAGVTALAADHRALWRAVGDDRTALVLEPLRWALAAADLGQPYRWVALEQVPAVLPVWAATAEALRVVGYSAAAGYVYAEAHGVPQTRKRAVLVASLDGPVALPGATHSRFHPRAPQRLDPGVAPWVSMAAALGWGRDDLVGFTRNAVGDDRAGGRRPVAIGEGVYRSRDLRLGSRPAFAVTSKARSWDRHYRERVAAEVAPRVRNPSGTTYDLAWPADRPAPTIAGRPLATMPGENANRFNPAATKSRNDGIRVAAWEAGVLQTFDPDYPWQGGRTAMFGQIGNAMPPTLARAVLAAAQAAQAGGDDLATCAECGDDLVCQGYDFCSECLESGVVA